MKRADGQSSGETPGRGATEEMKSRGAINLRRLRVHVSPCTSHSLTAHGRQPVDGFYFDLFIYFWLCARASRHQSPSRWLIHRSTIASFSCGELDLCSGELDLPPFQRRLHPHIASSHTHTHAGAHTQPDVVGGVSSFMRPYQSLIQVVRFHRIAS